MSLARDDWRTALVELAARREKHALVSVIATEGSAPRERLTKMVVTAAGQIGTIGGGHLELRATEIAREMLAGGQSGTRTLDLSLGPQLGQCCGGRVSLLIECFAPSEFTLALFGAGHVAKALIDVLGGVDLRVLWIDARAEQFPPLLPQGVERIVADDPADEIADLPADAAALVMTHSHDLDYRIVERLLARGDCRFVGLIGSASKRARFLARLARRGVPAEIRAQLVCPIGLSGVAGKHPREIAIAAAAQLLELRARAPAETAAPDQRA
jgi:xanthine dehydrogenase accessory factor